MTDPAAYASLSQAFDGVVGERESLVQQLDAANKQIEQVRALHMRIADNTAPKLGFTAPDMCSADGEAWPCPTIAALDASKP